MAQPRKIQKEILSVLKENICIKQKIARNTQQTFDKLKEVLIELTEEYNQKLKVDKENLDPDIFFEYRDRGPFECELRVATDLLLFSMHSNVFEFDRDHPIWITEYVQKDEMNSYSGIINIYNFLTDSFKYNRVDDLGYLVARLFINRNNHYFVEGKRQSDSQEEGLPVPQQIEVQVGEDGKVSPEDIPQEELAVIHPFKEEPLNKKAIRKIVETAILYSLKFDLLAPPYDYVKIATVAQMNERISHSNISTGKRVGFKFNADDV